MNSTGEEFSGQTPAIVAKGLHKAYRGAIAVESIDLSIPSGQIFGLVGPDGAGKSTILKIFSGLTKPTRGQCHVLGKNVIDDPESIHGHVGFMPQGLGLILAGKLTIRQNIDFFADLYHVEPHLVRQRSEQLLTATNLYDFQQRLASQLSGGMQQKLALCCTLIHHPRILILDEPTTGVDPVSRRDLWTIINDLVVNEGITVLIATSYLDEAERCHRVAMVHQGKILLDGDPIHLQSRTGKKELSEIFVDVLAKQSEQHHVRANLDRLIQKSVHLAVRKDEPVIRVVELSKKFGNFTAVDRISFDILPGEIFGFLGPNGAGKTTAIKMLCGILNATAGEAYIAGFHILHQRRRLKNRIGYMSQKFSLYRDLTVRENLELYRSIYGRQDHPVLDTVELLDMVGLEGFEDRMTDELPGGLKQRVALACSMVHLPDVLFLDEPTSGVDPLARERFWEIVRFLSRKLGITLLLTTHYMDEAEFCDRLAMIDGGKLVALGTPDQLKHQTEQEKGILLQVVCEQYLPAKKAIEQNVGPVVFFGRKLHLFSKQPQQDIEKIHQTMKTNAFNPYQVEPVPVRLEDVFIHFVRHAPAK
ncbi:MAG: ATP-binding cassette domain-containing protein [Phycisphaerae bacterium]